jgi:hypothetical protein
VYFAVASVTLDVLPLIAIAEVVVPVVAAVVDSTNVNFGAT